nr:hypothetical protein [Clostridia bacterium]
MNNSVSQKSNIPALLIRLAFLTLCLMLILFMLIHPEITVPEVRRSMVYCGEVLIPAVLPFLVLSSLLGITGFDLLSSSRTVLHLCRHLCRLLGISGCAFAVFVLSLVSGPPFGASYAAMLYSSGHITKPEAEHTAAISSGVSPAYLILGVGGGIFGNRRVGIVIWLSQVLAALVFGIVTSHTVRGKCGGMSASNPIPVYSAVPKAVSNAGRSMVTVCASVIFFTAVCVPLNMLLPSLAPYIRPLIELNYGLYGTALQRWYVGFACGFSGVCMLMQSAGELSEAGLSPVRLIMCRCVCAVICSVVCGVMALI